jgi:hypothetical protein
VLLGSAPARAQDSDPAQQRAAVQQKQAEVAAQIDTLKASDAEVKAAFDTINANVTSQRDRLADVQKTLADATAAVEFAQRQVAATQAELDGMNGRLRDLAVASYVRPPNDAATGVMIEGSPIDAPKRQALARFRVRELDDLLDKVRAKRQDVGRAQDAAHAARDEADRARATEEQRLAGLEGAQTQQATFVADVETRLDRALSESAALKDKDQQLAAEIQRREAALAAQVAAARQQSGAGGGSFGGVRSAGNVQVTTVWGITVNVQIAGQLSAMMSAAQADGVSLGGSGYRDPGEQIQLRMQNCGTSDYAIYQMSSSYCSPPTARPGSSMHEQGLAVDFTANGSFIQSRSNVGYQWLAGHAASYGFYNLPSEPWHWSINGS